jgi:hypothetical protein
MSHEYECVLPFYIDTEGYSDRDRLMFVCGFEICQLVDQIKAGYRGARELPIHTENASRVRMMGKYLGVKIETRDSGTEGWTWIEVIDP